MAREWRQRCSSNQERENHAWVYPLLDDGQAAWVVRKLVNLIRKEFYEPAVAFQPGLGWMRESPDHHRTVDSNLKGSKQVSQIYTEGP